MLPMRTLWLVAGTAVVAAALAGTAAVATSGAPNPPTPRVARLERQVATLQRQLAGVQTLAAGTAQQLQASHQAYDNLAERVAWLEARVDKLEGK